jgi:tRNA-dihydrouridine synthase A
MEWTDVHYRQLARLISKHTWLWTEMVVDKVGVVLACGPVC